ncbi:peroxide stress protein YaaA [Pseudonocardia sp. GCM10023141]|uniref:peroxide stress protein YaaA n=1 Tax=Pseudonocardia sp. GCM10023141 TaxID=3252653 RepID=UPI003617C3B9
MLVLLPPSETKIDGGDGPPLRLDVLPYPELDTVRKELVTDLVELSGDLVASRKALGISPSLDSEIARNAAIWTSPTMPALLRYTGVLYDALDVRSLRGTAAARAQERLAVGSALFGLLRACDPVPAYRLSAGSALPGRATIAARWKPVLEPVLATIATGELVVDLRSGSYAALAKIPGAVTVTVLAEHPDGHRTVVSHFNKAHKGRLARLLAGSRAEPSDAAGVATLARRAGMRVERAGKALSVIVSSDAAMH